MDERAEQIYGVLTQRFPFIGCELNYTSPYELLVAVVLSAQCTDKRVNVVTAELFKQANTPAAMLALGQEALQKAIYSCGFYKEKSKSIIELSRDLLDKFGGNVPDSLEQLTALRGVGRKTANVILNEIFGQNAVAVDTHVFRVSHRLGLSSGKTPLAVEKDLLKVFGNKAGEMHQLLVHFGRYVCKAARPECGECGLSAVCQVKS